MGRRANHRHSIQMPNCPHAGAALAWHVVILLRLALLITETGALPLGIMAVKNAMQNCKQHAQFHHDYTHCQRLSPTKRSHAVPCKGPNPRARNTTAHTSQSACVHMTQSLHTTRFRARHKMPRLWHCTPNPAPSQPMQYDIYTSCQARPQLHGMLHEFRLARAARQHHQRGQPPCLQW